MDSSHSSLGRALFKPLRAGAFLCVVLGTTLAAMVGVTLLPHDRYVRFQSLRGSLHARAEWVYDRIHNDPTPIDILVVGPSRSVTDIDPLLLQRDLRAQTGQNVNVAHFGFAEPGVDLMYLMVRETFETKKPKLVIVTVIDQQARYSHPAFKDLADVSDVLEAPIFVNLGYVSNLLFLPMRQLRLAVDSLFASTFHYRHAFDASAYLGTNINIEQTFPVHANPATSAEDLEKQVLVLNKNRTRPYLPESAVDYEFASHRYYFNRIAELARENHAQLLFVFTPSYKGPAEPDEIKYYSGLGSVVVGPDSIRLDRADFWDNYHLNNSGKQQFTTWLAADLSRSVMAWATP